MTPDEAYELILLALCVWREARGEPTAAKMGVACSIRNRVQRPSWWGDSYITCILKPYQFSSFNVGDPNATRFPQPIDTSWIDSLTVAQQVYNGLVADSVYGATSYFDKSLDASPPKWANDGSMVRVADIGNFHFYRRRQDVA